MEILYHQDRDGQRLKDRVVPSFRQRPKSCGAITVRSDGATRLAVEHAFTLLELMVVIVIFGVAASIIGIRTGNFAWWNEETSIRRISETISFLHYQAVADQSFYQLELDLTSNQFRAGVLRPDDTAIASLANLAVGAGNLTLELAAFQNPSAGDSQTFIPPPRYPSLAEPYQLPEGLEFEDVVTMRGMIRPGDATSEIPGDHTRAVIRFTPRGFSEFAVIHLRRSSGAQVTVLVNPFTGVTEIYPERREYQWSYGQKKT